MALSALFFQVNENNLPMNFRVTFWPIAGSSMEWSINFIQHLFFMFFAVTNMSAIFPITFLIMNHSCWHIEQTTELLSKINKEKENRTEMIKLVVQRSY